MDGMNLVRLTLKEAIEFSDVEKWWKRVINSRDNGGNARLPRGMLSGIRWGRGKGLESTPVAWQLPKKVLVLEQ